MLANRGFTLIEVLIALVITAVALIALSGSFAQSLNNSDRVRAKTIGLWVAEDIFNKYRIENNWPTRSTHGIYRQGGADWPWQLNIKPSSEENIYRVEVIVETPDGEETAARLESYFTRYRRSESGAY